LSELEGSADRALRYYELSAKTGSQAIIDRSTRPDLKGHAVQEALSALQAPALKSNKANVLAISLLGRGRVAEAEGVLQKALADDPANPFTLNNLGYVLEVEGDLQAALRSYSSAAAAHSEQTVVVAPNAKWRGKAISSVASENARLVSQLIAQGEDLDAKVARLNMRGVAALNHNDPEGARQFFEQAHRLDPHNAFSLNNMGYVSEMEGDRETAETYYQEARAAMGANDVITYASRRDAEGRRMASVAENNETDVDSRIEAARELKRRQGRPIELKRRGNAALSAPPPEEPSIQVEPSVQEQDVKQAPPLPVSPPPLPAPQLPDRSEPPPDQPQPPTPNLPNSDRIIAAGIRHPA
jgi:Flp pilus assembly protein TadD